MTRLLRFGPVLSACLALGACAKLIGLDQFDDKGGAEAGTAGSGGKGGTGAQGGSGGRAGTGGSSAGKAGAVGSGGTTGGAGGEAGASASGGKAGTELNPAGAAGMEEGGASGTGTLGGTGGTGGSTANGGAGAGGEDNGGCSSIVEISTFGYPAPFDNTTPDPGYAPYFEYTYLFNPELGSPDSDYLWIDFYVGSHYSGQETGHFVLGTGEEANYSTCSRCVYIGQDEDPSSFDYQTFYYAKSGTLDIASDSKQTNGKPNFQLTDVLFTEITIDHDNNSVSTEVPHGRCLHLASATVKLTVPSTWTCSNVTYGTNDGCDCGCGAPDPDCATELVGACDYCGDNGSCSDQDCTDITLAKNSTCTPSQGFTCFPTSYGDGQTCDCGCGVVDIDCASAASTECGYCGDPNACTATHGGDCSDIDAVDNSKCD